MIYEGSKRSWLLLALIVVLALPLFFAVPASAHGGEGEHLHGSVPLWLIELVYIQLFTVPFVGLWLVREAIGAWLRPGA